MNKNQNRGESRGIPRTHFWIPIWDPIVVGDNGSITGICREYPRFSIVTLDSIVSPLLLPHSWCLLRSSSWLLTLDSPSLQLLSLCTLHSYTRLDYPRTIHLASQWGVHTSSIDPVPRPCFSLFLFLGVVINFWANLNQLPKSFETPDPPSPSPKASSTFSGDILLLEFLVSDTRL